MNRPAPLLPVIADFRGQHEALSNFARIPVEHNGVRYPTLEHAFQAAKTTNAGDHKLILEAPNPAEAKRIGKIVDRVPDWEATKDGLMAHLVLQKAHQNYDFANYLCSLEHYWLVEGNTWGDVYWGCTMPRQAPYVWTGRNQLGQALMSARHILITEGGRVPLHWSEWPNRPWREKK